MKRFKPPHFSSTLAALEAFDFERTVRRNLTRVLVIPDKPVPRQPECYCQDTKWNKRLSLPSKALRQLLGGVGDPTLSSTTIGPVANHAQFEKVQQMIRCGLDEGVTLIAGGLGRPAGLDRGYYVKPTVFANVDNKMAIAQQEIFGPVLCIIDYDDEQDAINIANDSPFGLAGYISSASLEQAQQVAVKMRTGMVHLNGEQPDLMAPFGGYKQSKNGREWGKYGLEDFL